MALQKNIDEAVEVIKKSIEDKIAQNIRGEIEQTLLKDFLETLCHKVEQISKAKVVSYDFNKTFITFNCEIPKINSIDTQTAHQVIRTIDAVNLDFFFKKETNLHLFNFCSKYFLFSQYCSTREVNELCFTWSKNKFEENKICFCFMCKFNLELSEEEEEKKKQQELVKK